jgi:hypothetical protein
VCHSFSWGVALTIFGFFRSWSLKRSTTQRLRRRLRCVRKDFVRLTWVILLGVNRVRFVTRRTADQ